MYLIALLTITVISTGQSEAEDCKPDKWTINGTIGDIAYKPVFRSECNCTNDDDINSNAPYVCDIDDPSVNITDLIKSGQDIPVTISTICPQCEVGESYQLKSYSHARTEDENWWQVSKSSDECTFDETNNHTYTFETTLSNVAELADNLNIERLCFWAYLKSSDNSTSKAYATWIYLN